MVKKHYKVVLVCLDEGVLACLDEGVVACLDNNNKYDFDLDIRHILDDCFGYFLITHPLEKYS